jgi:hypothetical protein
VCVPEGAFLPNLFFFTPPKDASQQTAFTFVSSDLCSASMRQNFMIIIDLDAIDAFAVTLARESLA